MSPLLIFTSDEILTSKGLKDLYRVNFSETGNNLRPKKDDTLYNFECFLQDCDSEDSAVTLPQVLQFWTGSGAVPPLRFHKVLEIDFVPDNDLQNKLPVAHT